VPATTGDRGGVMVKPDEGGAGLKSVLSTRKSLRD
jgi:hypothetical protein